MTSKAHNNSSGIMYTFQASLQAFVGASEQAIANLTPSENFSKAKSFIDNFREFPIEIRRMIYHFLFEDAKLTVPWADIAPNKETDSKLGCLSPDEIVRKIEFHQAALLVVFEWCNEEALDILARQTTVEFSGLESWNSERANLLAAVDPTFLKHVKKVQMPAINFMRCDRAIVPDLEEVCLTHKVWDFDEDFSMLLDHVHICGELNIVLPEEFAYREFRNSGLDFEWRRKQLLHLAEEHGWKLRVLAKWFPHQASPERQVWYEIEYALDTRKVVKKGGVIKTKSEEVSGVTDVKRLQEVGLVNTWCYICSL